MNNRHTLGSALKMIRLNKNYTQKYVSDNIMSRSNYTKVEMDEVNPTTLRFFSILRRIDMSEAEFSFIMNKCKLSKKENILYLLKRMEQSPALSYVQKVITLSNEVLEENEDHMTRDILNLMLGYWSLLNDHDLEKAQEHAEKVWARLKRLNTFYLAEFHLLNRILYFFDMETAVEMAETALSKLEDYVSFEEAEDLRFSFMSNIACILIDNEEYDRAMIYVDRLIDESKQVYNVLVQAGALVRKGMCQSASGKGDASETSLHSASDMFKLLERNDLVEGITSNPKAVFNAYGYVNLMPHKSL